MADLQTPTPATPSVSETLPALQSRVREWTLECFGDEIACDMQERMDRFTEEALELAQSLGYDADRAHALVNYVFGRDKGEPSQEVGGTMTTLAALCNVAGIDILTAFAAEVARITQPEMVLKIRAKQAAKPIGSALPVATPSVSVESEESRALLRELDFHIEDSDNGLSKVPRATLSRIRAMIASAPNPSPAEAATLAHRIVMHCQNTPPEEAVEIVERLIVRAFNRPVEAPNPSPAAKSGEAKLSDAELAEAILDAEIDFGRWRAGEIKRVYGIESRMSALDAEAKRRGWVDGEKPALTTPSPQPADAVREAQDQAAIDAIIAMSDEEVIATSEPGDADMAREAFERAKEDVKRRRAALTEPAPAGEAVETAESAAQEVEQEHAAMLDRVAFVRRVVAAGVNIQGASEAANQVAKDSYKALLSYIDWLEIAIAVGRSQWQASHPTAAETARLREAVEPTAVNNLAFERFVLWFFRDLSEDQRLALFSLFGWPVSEITSTGAAKRVLRAIITPIAPEDTARLREDLEQAKRDRDMFSDWFKAEREGKIAVERERDDARKALETANALISEARSMWWSYRQGARTEGRLPAVWDKLVAADAAARSASREATR